MLRWDLRYAIYFLPFGGRCLLGAVPGPATLIHMEWPRVNLFELRFCSFAEAWAGGADGAEGAGPRIGSGAGTLQLLR